jgi:hypothetical protein
MVNETNTSSTLDRVVASVLVTLILAVLILQLSTLYSFPQPDGARWWGDETGQMIELQAEIQHGFASIPTGLGSTVAETNGIVRGNSWLAAIVYGIPQTLLRHTLDPVTTGRTITALLSILLCSVVFVALRQAGVSMLWSLFAVLILISTRSFYFASHAARLDVAAGCSLLLTIVVVSKKYMHYREQNECPSSLWWFAYGAFALLLATLSIHLLTLMGLFSVYVLLRFRLHRHLALLLAALVGVVAAAGLLLLVYGISGAPWTLFGRTVRPNQFQSVVDMLPIFRLFSRSVQVANILERIHGFRSEAPAFLILPVIAFGAGLVNSRRRTVAGTTQEAFLGGAALVVLLAWLLFQSPALYYYVQVLPIFAVVLILYVSRRILLNATATVLMVVASLLLSYASMRDVIVSSTLARELHADNHRALERTIAAALQPGRRPVVLAQNPAIAALYPRSDLQLMTAHFISFPERVETLAQTVRRLGVEYMLLYASSSVPHYSEDEAALRPLADSIGTLMHRETGQLFDVGKDYFSEQKWPPDTLLLYRIEPEVSR